MSTVKLYRLKFLCGLLCTLMTFTLSPAQTITGTVFDATGNVIAGASVKITDERRGSTRTATTSVEGDFSFAAMQPAIYTIRMETTGFRNFERKNTVLSANFRDIDGGMTFTLNPATGQVRQTNSRFGQPITAHSPRVMQGSLRLFF
jgi:hypothetical protein